MAGRNKLSWTDRVRSIKIWQLLIVLLLMSFVAASFLRINNTGMVERRNAVASADKSGDQNAINDRLGDLYRYVNSHMNTSSGVFYLQESYNRDVKAKMGVIDDPSKIDQNSPQAKADAICNPHLGFSGYSQAYQDCIVRELSKSGQVIDPGAIDLPNPSLYRHSFLSPRWSPDFAGWSVLVCLILGAVISVRLLSLIILRLTLMAKRRGQM